MAARADKNTTHINKQAAEKWLVGLYQRTTKVSNHQSEETNDKISFRKSYESFTSLRL